jgi:hypothetical protein
MLAAMADHEKIKDNEEYKNFNSDNNSDNFYIIEFMFR